MHANARFARLHEDFASQLLEQQEDAREAHHLLEQRRRGDLHGLAAEARCVVELVAVEAGGARQEGADEAADQERLDEVTEGDPEALALEAIPESFFDVVVTCDHGFVVAPKGSSH